MRLFLTMLYRALLAISCLILFLSTGTLSIAHAQESILDSYVGGVQLVNLADTPNVCLFTIIDESGNPIGPPIADQIPANGTVTYFPLPIDPDAPHSLMIDCELQFATIANLLTGDFSASASYGTPIVGANTIDLPLLQKDNNGFQSWQLIQNLSDLTAEVEVSYSDGASAELTIPSLASKVLSQEAEEHMEQTFSGTLISSQLVRVAAFQESSDMLFGYTGIPRQETTATEPLSLATLTSTEYPVFPLVNIGGSDWVTGIQLMNAGGESTEITVVYTPVVGTACSETRTVEAGASATFTLAAFDNGEASNCTPGARFIGSAVVSENSTSQPLIGIANQLSMSAKSGGAYVGFATDQATNGVVLPLIMDRNRGYFTGISVMHLSGPASDVTCTFTDTSYSVSDLLEEGDVLVDIQQGKIAEGYVGSARCIADEEDARIVAIVNQLNNVLGGDQLLVYEGIAIE